MKDKKQVLPLVIVLALVALILPASLYLVLNQKGETRSRAQEGMNLPYPGCCVPYCDKIGTKSEGWYDSCTRQLIKYDRCGDCGIKPTPKPISGCNKKCNPTINPPVNCEKGLTCFVSDSRFRLGAWGVCRNQECLKEKDCICKVLPTPEIPVPTIAEP